MLALTHGTTAPLRWTHTRKGHPLVLVGAGPLLAAVLYYRYTYASERAKHARFRVYFPHVIAWERGERVPDQMRMDFNSAEDALAFATAMTHDHNK